MKYLDSNVDDQVCGWAYSVHDVHNTSLHTYESDFPSSSFTFHSLRMYVSSPYC